MKNDWFEIELSSFDNEELKIYGEAIEAALEVEERNQYGNER